MQQSNMRRASKAKDEYQYVVPVVKEKFEAALAEAEKVNADAAATQETVDAAYENLLEMIHHLDFTGNTSELKVLVDVAKGLNEEVYTPETWAPFAEALKAAEAVLADENATQAQVQAAHDNLRNAEFGLRLIPNKDALEDLINKVENMDLSKYSDDVQKEIRSALDNAKAVMADENATQDDVDGAVKLLQASVDKAEGTTATDNKNQAHLVRSKQR